VLDIQTPVAFALVISAGALYTVQPVQGWHAYIVVVVALHQNEVMCTHMHAVNGLV
jgi:hypothetical protein